MKTILLSLEDVMISTLTLNQHRRLPRAEMAALIRKQAEDHISDCAGLGDSRVRIDSCGQPVVEPAVRHYISNAIDMLLGCGEDGR